MSSPATSKLSLRARITDDLLKQLRSRSKAERKLVGEAMNAAIAAWGKPHSHSGAGIRRLTKSIFECRAGLEERIAFLFVTHPPELVFFFIGDHDEIQRLIRSMR